MFKLCALWHAPLERLDNDALMRDLKQKFAWIAPYTMPTKTLSFPAITRGILEKEAWPWALVMTRIAALAMTPSPIGEFVRESHPGVVIDAPYKQSAWSW